MCVGSSTLLFYYHRHEQATMEHYKVIHGTFFCLDNKYSSRGLHMFPYRASIEPLESMNQLVEEDESSGRKLGSPNPPVRARLWRNKLKHIDAPSEIIGNHKKL